MFRVTLKDERGVTVLFSCPTVLDGVSRAVGLGAVAYSITFDGDLVYQVKNII